MNDALRMQISAFVDGELPDNESELLLRRLSQDAELRQEVARFLEIGRAIRQEAELPNMGLLRGRIAESLGAEAPAADIPAAAARGRWFKPVAGFAVAASVALLAIFSLQQVGEPVDAVAPAPQLAGSDQLLDDMFRHHGTSAGGVTGSGIFAELVNLDLSDSDLVRVEPKAQLIAPVEIQSEAKEEESGENKPESDTADVQAE